MPIVTGGTFGSIIVHIEAENIANISVPRLDQESGDAELDDLIQLAANKRVEASNVIQMAIEHLKAAAGIRKLTLCRGDLVKYKVCLVIKHSEENGWNLSQ